MSKDKFNKKKLLGSNFVLASTLSIFALLGANNVIAKQEVSDSNASDYAYQVLINTEAAINRNSFDM